MEYSPKDLKKFFVKVVSTFVNDQGADSLREFMELLNGYAQFLNAKSSGQMYSSSMFTINDPNERAMDKNSLLQNLSSLFAKYDLNDDFDIFLPLQSKGVSLLAEVQYKNPTLHKEILKILCESEEGESIGENEIKIKELLNSYPEWQKRFEPFLQQNSAYDSDAEESKSNMEAIPQSSGRTGSRMANRKNKANKTSKRESVYPERRLKSSNEEDIKNYDQVDQNNDELEDDGENQYVILDDGMPARSLSKNEMNFFEDLKKLFADEILHIDDKSPAVNLFDIVMKAFTLYVDGLCGADELFSLLEQAFSHIDEFEQFKSFCMSREVNRRKETWFCRNLDDSTMKE